MRNCLGKYERSVMEIKKNRNYGLDIIRIGAMCGIIVLHIAGQGGALAYSSGNNIRHWMIWWVEICAYCSVDLLAVLSGWLGIKQKKYSTYRILELLSIVICYCIMLTLVFFFLGGAYIK